MDTRHDIKNSWIGFIVQLQNDICKALETCDGGAKFREDYWQRPGGGWGKTRVIQNGNIFEKGGVNISVVFGDVTEAMKSQLKINGDKWFACGLSLVIHPANPFVPTVHCNYRMFELYDGFDNLIDRWFGGGTDLTPYYLDERDAVHFHTVYKAACDKHDKSLYPWFKKNCDDYFVNTHRDHERRGIGGIFYDYQREDSGKVSWPEFAKDCGYAFIDAYIPIVEKQNKNKFEPHHKFWQEIRRGRYVEFNLVHDRGTLFGLKTNGRTESILMSLPATARFEYDHHPVPGSEEDKLLQVCLHPREWIHSVKEKN